MPRTKNINKGIQLREKAYGNLDSDRLGDENGFKGDGLVGN